RALQERASHRLGLVLDKLGDFAGAVELLNHSVTAIRATGDGETLPMALNDLACLLMYNGDLTAAARAADEALAVWSTAQKDTSPDVLPTAGAIAFRQGRVDQAGLYFRLALAADPSYAAAVPYNLEGLALAAAASSRPERALRLAAAASASRPIGGRN